MAYVSQEDKKKLTPAIKAVLKKYNMKGTLAVRHHMSLVCNIKEGALDIIGAKNESMVNSRHYDTQCNPYDCQSLANRLQDNYVDVNTYWIEDNYGSNPTVVKFLEELKSAMEGEDFYCEDDPMTDYFHRSHYVDINVGSYNKPYVCTGETKDFSDVVENYKQKATELFAAA